jgi:rare lipoprotein A (peptidoglycan hydrolase)
MCIVKSIAVVFAAVGALGLSVKLYSGFHDSSIASSRGGISTSSPLATSPPEELDKISHSSDWIEALDEKLFTKGTPTQHSARGSATDVSFNALTSDGPATSDRKQTQNFSINHFMTQTVGSWFDQFNRVSGDWKSVLPAVLVVARGDSSVRSTPEMPSSIAELRTAFWQCSPRQNIESTTPATEGGLFQVWVKGCQIAELPTRESAEELSTRLSELLRANNLDLSKLRAVYQDDHPIMMLGDKTVFVITPEISQQLGRNGDLIAINWINHLRAAVGQPEIELAKAQSNLYGLEETNEAISGSASWYGPYFHGRITATGEVYNQFDLTAASRTLPFDTYVKITNRQNGKQVIVRINDRGPYVDEHLRILDLSYAAATCLDSDESGVVPIDAVILKPAPGSNLRTAQKVNQAAL